MPEEQTTRVLDAHSLRGLAHPLRMRLLVALRHGGPATASQLAGKLGESSGATSYHLRQLAAHGFVEDAPEHGKGRERWWRALSTSVQLDDTLVRDADPVVRGAAAVFRHEVATVHTQELDTWVANSNDWAAEWGGASDMSDFTLRLTPDLARELVQRMHELIRGYGPAPEGAPDAETVRVHTHLFPTHTA
ncbi:winged helix-turn-helix domain-containing protein [Streptomyces sp. NPDC021356]|uniref:ArsR/SmtB family transcription factor n=1 Tax=Streptomyces sp. NPDC021356 TaxID=3154900 RepID=UPI0033DA4C28